MLGLLHSIFIITAVLIDGCTSVCTRNGVECLDYVVLNRHEGYEERQYPGLTWMSTFTESSSFTDENKEMFTELLSYFRGNNDRGLKMNTTAPVRSRIIPCEGAACATSFSMSFLIPSALKGDTPEPLDDSVFIHREPPVRYAVRMFDGRPTEVDWLEQAEALANLVKKDPLIETDNYYTVSYDSPYQLQPRLNEIWMYKKTVLP